MISLLTVEENAAGKKTLSPCCVVSNLQIQFDHQDLKSNKSNFNFSRANKAKLLVFVGN